MAHFLRFVLVLTIAFAIAPNALFSQHLPTGPEAAGLGFASVSRSGRVGIWDNPAGLIGLRNQQILCGYENRYGLSNGLNVIQAGFVQPVGASTGAISIYRFGDDLYSQHKLSLSMGHQIGQFRGGFRLNQHQFSMEGADTRYSTALDFGVIASLSEEFAVGVQISNLTRARVSGQTGERSPTVLRVGFDYRPDKHISLLGELTYELDYSPVVKLGLEYEPLKFIAFRSGMNTGEYTQLFAGLGLQHRVVQFDYAFEIHPVLGISQHFGLAYQLQPDAEK